MASSNNLKAVSSGHRGSQSVTPRVPLVTRHDVALLFAASCVAFFGGVLAALAFFATLPFDLLLLFGALAALGAVVLVATLQRRATARAIESESAPPPESSENDTLHLTLERQAPSESTETKPFAPNGSSSVKSLPVVRGWELLGTVESDIAPQLAILMELFQGQAQVEIRKRFAGGHRNRGVYLVRSSAEAERVVKIARSADIRAERSAQELINRFSHNNGGQLVRDLQGADDNDLGGIVYRLALLRRGATVTNFTDLYCSGPTLSESTAVIEQLYADVLPHSQFRETRSLPLFREYEFPTQILDKVWTHILALPLLRDTSRNDETVQVALPQKVQSLRNPIYWAQNIMPTYRDREMQVYAGVIHGDLHSGNILIELPGPNLRIIDFAKTRAGAHTLNDYAKLEADCKFYLLPGQGEPEYFEQALRFEEQWLLPAHPENLTLPLSTWDSYSYEFQKAGTSVATIRRMAQSQHPQERTDCVGHFADDSVLPYYLSLFHATLRVLTYEQCNDSQKVYAFVAAALLCERMTQLLR